MPFPNCVSMCMVAACFPPFAAQPKHLYREHSHVSLFFAVVQAWREAGHCAHWMGNGTSEDARSCSLRCSRRLRLFWAQLEDYTASVGRVAAEVSAFVGGAVEVAFIVENQAGFWIGAVRSAKGVQRGFLGVRS